MQFCEALRIRPGITALIGGGGKTTLLFALARELSSNARVIVCTTTHMLPPDNMPVLTGAGALEIEAELKKSPVLCVGEEDGAKLTAPQAGVEALCGLADYVIAEADGAKHMPLKAHAPHEPVIPAGANVIYVVGADGIGKPVCSAAHRPELYSAKLGTDASHIVTPADAAAMIDYGRTVLFNKADTNEAVANGVKFAACFAGRTVIASLMQNRVIKVIDNV